MEQYCLDLNAYVLSVVDLSLGAPACCYLYVLDREESSVCVGEAQHVLVGSGSSVRVQSTTVGHPRQGV